MRGPTLVTGGSDGSVRVWSLTSYTPIHRLAAHDNSVTSLQFDDSRIVSGGSDGRVKIWDLKTGGLIRELSQPAEQVWRVAFEEEKSVVLANRQGRTVMEIWNFAPPAEDGEEGEGRSWLKEEEGEEEAEMEGDLRRTRGVSEENVDMVDAYGGGSGREEGLMMPD